MKGKKSYILKRKTTSGPQDSLQMVHLRDANFGDGMRVPRFSSALPFTQFEVIKMSNGFELASNTSPAYLAYVSICKML